MSSEDRAAEGDTTKLNMARVIPGWAEGLKMIGKGGKIKLWVPSNLGYGSRPMAVAFRPIRFSFSTWTCSTFSR